EHSPYQAQRLVEKFPQAALPALRAGAKAAKWSQTRVALVKAAGEIKGGTPLPFLTDEVKNGPYLASRLAAARCLHDRGRPEGVVAMIAEWNGQGSARHAKDSQKVTENAAEDAGWLEYVAGFLAGCGNLEAIQALGKDLRKRPVDLRLAVISS